MAKVDVTVDVNETLTKKVAKLARVKLTDAEVTQYTRQLKDILQYVDQLSEVDVNGVEPLTNPLPYQLSAREDVVKPFEGNLVASAPEILYDGYKVPPIL